LSRWNRVADEHGYLALFGHEGAKEGFKVGAAGCQNAAVGWDWSASLIEHDQDVRQVVT